MTFKRRILKNNVSSLPFRAEYLSKRSCHKVEKFGPAAAFKEKNHRVKSVQIRNISPYSVQCWKIRTRKNSVYGHFLRSEFLCKGVINLFCDNVSA